MRWLRNSSSFDIFRGENIFMNEFPTKRIDLGMELFDQIFFHRDDVGGICYWKRRYSYPAFIVYT